MAYISLLIAGLLEVGWATSLEASHGFTQLGPTLLTVFLLVCSFYFLNFALRAFGVGVTYAVFTGIGTAGTSLVGMAILGEPVSVGKLLALGILLLGIIGLELSNGKGERP
ncbi:DMT family transporter [Loigolactobacillus backii]|uniref:Uncharacterized protein n=1 Tax=Loigolactobacillus backii TaxID=375175 RepID=A0A192H1C0_9LACO|nr:multidrug efflux SMR transporter [Loigolactobacillus backii]ANK59187.1 hypothetical protein AYR52_02215 [Loigolactobacillus backii]ANK62599.1 hypothetical protein AYR53_07330 [Loigolactobacillus backii]ANK64177.1 hypothetical protein AYR54_02210 [Loigolactobacillus backii]ANK67428.1 hypothetical protein AYR55_06825 [Loigolactobacillus backii]ANK70391.1 hypothetical protein AYR56_09670 [Loigolactobacillus backii]